MEESFILREPLVIKRGTDEQILIKIYEDSDKTIPISIDDLDDVQIRVTIGNEVISQYNKTGLPSPFIALTRLDEYTYYFWLQTSNATPTGMSNMWIEIIDTNAVLVDSEQNTIRMATNIFNIQSKPY